MKKLFALCVTVVICLCSFTACDRFEKDITGYESSFQCKKYENCDLFTFDNFSSRETASFALERTGLGEGTIYYYVNLEKGALSIQYKNTGFIYQDEPLGDFTADDEMPMNGTGGYVEGNKITITFESFNPVSGEIIIAFTEDALKAVHKDLQHHEHTFTYEIREDAHKKIYTCDCTNLEQRDFEPHDDEDGNGKCDECGYDMSEPPSPTNHFLRNQAGCEWLNEITAEEIAQVKIIDQVVGVDPGTLKTISSSTDETVIARIFEKYYRLDTTPISKEEGQIDGGGAVTVKFIMKDGTERQIYVNNGNYRDSDDNYFELLYTPYFEGGDNVATVYGFITYISTGTVYDGDNNPVCEIPVEKFEFIVFEDAYPAVDTGYFYTVDTEFGKLLFHYSCDLFYLKFNGEKYYRGCYQLVGKNLDEWIAEYSATAE